MKLAAFCVIAMMGMRQTPDGPTTTSNPKYPLKVEVLVTKARDSRYGTRGMGRGNLLADEKKGIDFSYTCNEAFLNTGPGESYPARWKKQDARLELLMQRIGSDKMDTCDIDIAYKSKPYAEPKR